MNYRKSEAKQAARAQFRGVWAAIPTPFTPDYQVNEAGLRHNMRHLTSGLHITEKERQQMRADLERTGLLGRVPTAKAA